MTVKDIEERLEQIRKFGFEGDDESAHFEQDRLYVDVLRHFATNAPGEFADVAMAALKVEDIEFCRWYA